MAQRRKLEAMAKPNKGLPVLGGTDKDPRSFPKTRPPNPTGEPRIGPPTQGDLTHEGFESMGGLMNVAGLTPVGGKASPLLEKFAQYLEESYPRISKNINSLTNRYIPSQKMLTTTLGRAEGLPLNTMPDRTNNPKALREFLKKSNISVDVDAHAGDADVAHTLIHEFTHGADQAADVNFGTKHENLAKLVPYELLPGEIKANRVAEKLGPSFVEANRRGSTPKNMRKAKGEISRFNRREIPGSMAEFAPVEPPPLDDFWAGFDRPAKERMAEVGMKPRTALERDALKEDAFKRGVKLRKPGSGANDPDAIRRGLDNLPPGGITTKDVPRGPGKNK